MDLPLCGSALMNHNEVSDFDPHRTAIDSQIMFRGSCPCKPSISGGPIAQNHKSFSDNL